MGYCLEKQGLRHFKLARVKNLKLTGERFDRRDLSAILPDEGLADEMNDCVALKLRIDQEMTYRIHDEFNEDEVEMQPDGSCIISVAWKKDN